MNPGKLFEQDFIKSIPENVFSYKLKDSAGSWQGGEKTRFTSSNICDLIVYYDYLLLLELKSHKGKSFPLSCIRKNQIEGLVKANKKGVTAGFIFNFRDLEETYYLSAWLFTLYFKNNPQKKSIPLDFIKEKGEFIPQHKKRTRWVYDLRELLDY